MADNPAVTDAILTIHPPHVPPGEDSAITALNAARIAFAHEREEWRLALEQANERLSRIINWVSMLKVVVTPEMPGMVDWRERSSAIDRSSAKGAERILAVVARHGRVQLEILAMMTKVSSDECRSEVNQLEIQGLVQTEIRPTESVWITGLGRTLTPHIRNIPYLHPGFCDEWKAELESDSLALKVFELLMDRETLSLMEIEQHIRIGADPTSDAFQEALQVLKKFSFIRVADDGLFKFNHKFFARPIPLHMGLGGFDPAIRTFP